MKRVVNGLLIVISLCLFMACPTPGGGSGGGGVIYPDIPRDTWTVLVHFAVDNNIDFEFERFHGIVSNYLNTLESIEAADTDDKIDIVVLMDCYNTDTQGEGYVSTFDDGYYHLTGGDFDSDLIVDIAEVNSGSLAETEDFLDWAVANYPADGYMYSIFNHGGGFDDQNIEGTYADYGIAFDDSHDDCLSHHEVGQATAHLTSLIGHNVDLFHAFACLMGGVELAYEMHEHADYMLFSEELFPADYWSYEALATITDSSDPVSALDIGKAFCDSAYNYFSAPVVDRSFTLSLICLSMIEDLANALSSYADAAITDINSSSNQADYNNVAYISFSMLSRYINDFYYMDLGDYCANIRNRAGIGSHAKNTAAAVQSAMSDCVTYMRNHDYPDASGITIFHNIWDGTLVYHVTTYKSILTFGSNSWADYLELMVSFGPLIPEADIYEPDNDFTTSNVIAVDGAAQEHTLHMAGDEDYMMVTLSAGTVYKIETHSNSVDTNTRLYLYNSAHTQVEYDYNSGEGNYSLINYYCPSTGTYYIRVRESSSSGTGDYLIDVQELGTIQADVYEPDNDFSTTNTISVGAAAQAHTLYGAGDEDYMRVYLNAGTTYKIETYFNLADTDTRLYLYNSAHTQVADNDDGGAGYYSLINYSCTSSGFYYIRVRDYYSNRIGDYLIDVQTSGLGLDFTRDDVDKNNKE
ncbi:MAG: pre-peptidase C-terminal domain-containing protein [Spirochaetales bacterium]|nr:pre-peptidase C-terminal domain-containing protein [Spirochaetales bacterium]